MLLPSDSAAQVTRARRLGELIDGFPERVRGALPALRELLDGAADDEVLAAAIDAIGLAAGDDAAATLLLGRGLEQHGSSDVRLALARALATVAAGGDVADQAADALARLSADADGGIRVWSCFALGALGADGPAVREALVARLDDESSDARCEAVAALARLGDERVVPVLRRHFEQDDPFDVYQLELSAAAAIADPTLLAGLLRIDAAWQDDRPTTPVADDTAASPLGIGSSDGLQGDRDSDDETELFEELDRAIAACRARI